MLDTTTKRRIDTARDILVGKVPDPKSQVEQITIALIYKFMDDMDLEAEELGGIRSFFTGEYEKYSWHKLFDPSLSGFEVLNLYGEALLRLSINPALPQLFRDIFKNAYLPYRDPETLKGFIKIINDFTYNQSEKLGDAFEYLLSVLGSQGDAGQFRTPRHIIDFMVEIIDPQKIDAILDPACGTAGFLISSYKHIWKNNSSNYNPAKDKRAFEVQDAPIEVLGALNGKRYNGDKLTPDERTRLINNICGYDISPDMVRLSLVNLYLHGFTEPNIFEYDTLTSQDKWNEYFDVIMANPPFMSPKGGIKPHKRFSMESSRSEVLFVDYIAEHLTPTGRAAIIVPEGIIFQSGNAYKQLRKMLVEENYLVGVISLPAGVFNPYSGVKTSILWIDKSLARKTENILFVKISNDGFDLGAQRRPIKLNDLPGVYQQMIAYRQTIEKRDVLQVPEKSNLILVRRDILANKGEYILSGERYSKTSSIYKGVFVRTKIADICDLQSGFAFDASLFNEDEGFPIIRIRDIKTNRTKTKYLGAYNNNFIVNNGDLIIGMDGEFNTCIWNGGPALLNQRVCRLLNFRNSVKGYIFWIIQKKLKEIEDSTYAVTVKHISGKQILNIEIPFPPLPIQQEIEAEIEGYQKIIDGARQVVVNYKPSIDIDPEWPVVELGTVIEFISGLTLSIPDCEDPTGVPIISMNSIREDGELVHEGIRTIKLPTKKNIYYLRKGDLLFNWRNGSKHLVGKTARFDWDGEYVFASFLLGIRPFEDVLQSKYLWYLLNKYRKDGEYLAFMRQNVNGLFNREELKILKISLPPIKIQQTIITRIEEEQQLVAANKRLIELYEQKIKERIARVWGA
jgi:type I restriction enzyme M protein